MERSKGDGLKRKMEQEGKLGKSGGNSTSSTSTDTDQRKRAKLCEQLKPGDLIEIFQDGFKDWVLYEGDGHVVHLYFPSEYPWTQRKYDDVRCNVLVKRERLEDVVGSYFWQVNNHLDHKCHPQPVERILSAARGKVGQVMEFSAWFNCEHFVDSLRYGLVPRQQPYEDPKPGDIIKISYKDYEDHWVLYEGQNYVIHLVTEGGTCDPSSKDSGQSSRVVVKRELLKDVVRDYPYCVDSFLDYEHPSLPVNKILSVAQEMIGKEMEYRDEGLECDDFLKYLRYGVMKSNDSFHEEPKPGDILVDYDSLQHWWWWGIYEGDGYVIYPEYEYERSETRSFCYKCVVKRESLIYVMNCNSVKNAVKWNLLKDVVKWDLLTNVVKSDLLKNAVKWDLLKYMVKWKLLRNMVNWNLLKDVLKSNPLKDVMKWDHLKDVVKWDHLKDMVKWDLVKDVVNSDLLKDVVNWDLLKDVVKWDHLKNIVKGDFLKDVVKLDLLKDVVNWDLLKDVMIWDKLEQETTTFTYQINNHLDDKFPPRPVDMILSAAKEKVGEEIKCITPSSISEHFATSLRYGLVPTEQFHEEIKPGDLIEIFCAPHHHWAISVGDGRVVHLTPPSDTPDLLNKSPAHRQMEVVKRKLLKDVAGDCPYWVNNLFDHKFPPLPVNEILRAAEKRIGKEMESSDGSKDSEHFVSSLRYGMAITEQVHKLPKPGDLVEIYNSGDKRWAICEGDGYVIHVDFTGDTNEDFPAGDEFVVKRSLVKDVLGSSPYRINNYLDNKYPPLSVYNILSTMRAKVDRKFSCEWRCQREDFVTSLRYGLVPREQFQTKPRSEDVIEIFHLNEKHWALYEGDGYIIHLIQTGDKTTASSFPIRAVVKRELLKDAVGDGHYEVASSFRHHSGFSQRSDTIHAAKQKIGEEMELSVWNNSSEHFVTYLKFGKIYDEPFCEDLKPGDIIEISAGSHQNHWAIYEGSGYLVHLAPPSDKTDVDASSQHPDQSLRAVVKRELLKDVVGDSDYRVENHFDKEYRVQPVNKILSVAKEKIGKEVEYRAQGNSAKHFATYLRYGVCYDEEFCDEPNVGDLIECFLTYNRWTIYEGNGYIIHLATISDPSSSRDRTVVKREPLKEVAGTCGYRVNNYLDYKYTPQPVSRILSATQEKVGEDYDYNRDGDSEQFFTKLRYGDIPNQ